MEKILIFGGLFLVGLCGCHKDNISLKNGNYQTYEYSMVDENSAPVANGELKQLQANTFVLDAGVYTVLYKIKNHPNWSNQKRVVLKRATLTVVALD